MHFKRIFSVLPANLRLFWERITASRITIIYFAFSIFNCVLQVVFQAQAFSINVQADHFLSGLISKGNISLPTGFFVLDSELHFCDHVPNNFSTESCKIVWDGEIGGTGKRTKSVTSLTPTTTVVRTTTTLTATPTARALVGVVGTQSHHDKRFLPQPQLNISGYHRTSSKGQIGVKLTGLEINGKNITLDNKCLVNLMWPVQTLKNTKREDVSFLAFQFWVLGMSVVALLNESIPHIIAAVLTHLSATAWSAFQVFDTKAFHSDFKRLITDGACHVNLLPNYWSSRAYAEIPSLACNVAALLLSCFLSFKLIKLFGWQTFKRVGACRTINRVYKLVLILSTVIQLSLFFVVTGVTLWLDQLYNGRIAIMASKSSLYQAMLTLVIILLIPWLLTGWFAARLEWKPPMIVFLVLSALYLVGWGVMFDSSTFRWTFVQWGFFGAMATASALLILIGFIVGIMCLMNFNKGLLNYLNAEEPLQEGSFIQREPDEESITDEKFDFPSTRHPIPTFSGSFGSNNNVPLPGQMGPRFFNQSALPFDRPVDTESGPNLSVDHSTNPLTRNLSERSTSSQASSTVSMDAPSMGRSRWVIE
jgi:hypothetical protein